MGKLGVWKKRYSGFTEQWETPKGALVEVRPYRGRGSGYGISAYPAKITHKKLGIYAYQKTKKEAIKEARRFMKTKKKGF